MNNGLGKFLLDVLFLTVDTVVLEESKLELLLKIFQICGVYLVSSWKRQMIWCPGTDT